MAEQKRRNRRRSSKRADQNRVGCGRKQDRFRSESEPKTSDMHESFPDHNDWRFYAVDEVIAKQVANIPFNVLSGDVLGFTATAHDQIAEEGSFRDQSGMSYYSVGGLMILHYVPSVGVSLGSNSGISIAANQLYAEMRKNNSGAKNYEAPDLLMFVLAVQDLIRNIAETMRVLRLTDKYTFKNKFTPKVLVENGLGFDYDDLMANRAVYMAQLNTLIASTNTLGIPKYFTSLMRRVYVASTIWKDSDANQGQLYAMRSFGYYTWDTKTEETGTSLQFTPYTADLDAISTGYRTLEKLSDRLSTIEAQISAILSDTDALTMEGDIQKAWDPSNLVYVNFITQEEVQDFTFDEDALAQIENAVFSPIPITAANYHSTLNVTQQNGAVHFQPVFQGGSPSEAGSYLTIGDRVFNSHKVDPDYTDVLEWSRLSSVWSAETGSSLEYTLVSAGLEVVVAAHVVYMHQSTSGVTPYVNFFVQGNYISSSAVAGTVFTTLQSALQISQFDWHPAMYVAYGNMATTGPLLYPVGMDVKVATVVSAEAMTRIHQAANYAAYYNFSLKK